MDAALFRACARLPLNDTSNGARFKVYFGDRARWSPRIGWGVLRCGRWVVDPDGIEVRRLAHRVASFMVEEADHIEPDSDVSRELRQLVARLAAIDGRPGLAVVRGELRRRVEAIDGPLARRRAEHRSFAVLTGTSARIDAMLREASVNLVGSFGRRRVETARQPMVAEGVRHGHV